MIRKKEARLFPTTHEPRPTIHAGTRAGAAWAGPVRRALGCPKGLQALRHAVATPMRQYFESVKTKVNLAHRAIPPLYGTP